MIAKTVQGRELSRRYAGANLRLDISLAGSRRSAVGQNGIRLRPLRAHARRSRHVSRFSKEAAIKTACLLIDEGCDVFGVGTGPLTDTIAGNEIARIYAIWAREKRPFGQISN